jgi:hypothetical protein
MKAAIIIALLGFLSVCGELFAAEDLFYKEVNVIGGYSDRDQWIGKTGELSNSVGFEYYRKFSGDYGDFLTADVQMRLAYDSMMPLQDALGIEVHNAWLQYKLTQMHKVKVGHFRSPFGLEQVIDTHGTILQTLASMNIGYKKDWGFALEGALPAFDYSLALQAGSGMGVYRRDDSFLSAVRAGSPAGRNAQVGFSLLYGRVLETQGMSTFPRPRLLQDGAVLKKRIGLDTQFNTGPFLAKSEVAYGTDEHDQVLGFLFEMNYTVPQMQNLQLELQYNSWQQHLGERGMDDSSLIAGISFKATKSLTLRAAFVHDLNLMEGAEDDKIILQAYYYGF